MKSWRARRELSTPAAIHFYCANLVGRRRKLFPELVAGYRNRLENGSPAGAARIAGKGREHRRELAREMFDPLAHPGDASEGRMEQLIDSDAALM